MHSKRRRHECGFVCYMSFVYGFLTLFHHSEIGFGWHSTHDNFYIASGLLSIHVFFSSYSLHFSCCYWCFCCCRRRRREFVALILINSVKSLTTKRTRSEEQLSTYFDARFSYSWINVNVIELKWTHFNLCRNSFMSIVVCIQSFSTF